MMRRTLTRVDTSRARSLIPRARHLCSSNRLQNKKLSDAPDAGSSSIKEDDNDVFIARWGKALSIQQTDKPDSVLARVSERFALPQLLHTYSKNTLTHGEQFLKGDDEYALFAPGVWHAPLKWRPIPGPDTVSLSRATLSTTEAGTAMLRGLYGGSRGEFALLAGSSANLEDSPVGAGACGVASLGHWPVPLDQHHWLELRVRTGNRAFELILQADGNWEGSTRIWRASIPEYEVFERMQGREPKKPKEASSASSAGGGGGGGGSGGGGGVGRGAYGVLSVAADASDAEIRESYRELVMACHPDRPGGGDIERFKAVSRAYALLGDPEKRARYDEVGAELDDGEDDDAGLDDLGPWRQIKVPFTAFKDRSFFERADAVSAVYVLLAGETPGSFALEIGEIKAGRCENAHLTGANYWNLRSACEQGHCECGFYNGMRAEAFDGPIKAGPNGRLRRGALEWGHAEHHLAPGEIPTW